MSEPTRSSSAPAAVASPTPEELEDLLLACRYGDLEDVQSFLKIYGSSHFASFADERGNTCLHMAAANGHTEVVSFLLPHLPTSALIRPNHAPSLNTPLHWSALNHHLPILKLLCPKLTPAQISATNGRGRSAMSEAMEGVGKASRLEVGKEGEDGEGKEREEVVGYLVEMMKLGDEEEDEVDENETTETQKEEQITNGVKGLTVEEANIETTEKPAPGTVSS